jgi:polyhydroxyalkanoate synthesis regulator phasin
MDIIKKAMLLGLGVVSLTKEKAEEFVDDLIKRGEVSKEEKFKIVEELLKEAEQQKKELVGKLTVAMQKVIVDLGLPTKKDLDAISKRFEEIEKRMS